MFDFDVITGPNPVPGQSECKTAATDRTQSGIGAQTIEHRSDHAAVPALTPRRAEGQS
jgi:hypothetical protein